MPRLHATLLASGLVLAFAACASTAATDSTKPATAQADAALDAAIADPARDPKNVLRDVHRHPRETLGFFQVKPDATIIEISPSGGWYSEILAPYLRDDGRYVAATGAAPADSGGGKRNAALQAKFAASPARYDRVQWLEYGGKAPVLGAPGAADVVLTFRNVHNWVAAGTTDAYFQAFFAALKPGGVLGVVDHRARPGTDLDTMKKSGYLTEALSSTTRPAPASCWTPAARSTPIRRTAPTIRTACGRCRRPIATMPAMPRSTRPSAKATG